MAHPSEIEKLEQRYRENPKGRNFAPLADAYRKAGLLDHAIELCKSGLQRHPDYVSAHIVHGRCLIDQKNDSAASEAFRKVLALDPENVLALRMLAEIAERGGRFDEAVEWLGRLVTVDAMNEDAADALARAKRRVAPAPAKPPAPVATAPVPSLHSPDRPAPAPAAPARAPAPAPAPAPAFQAPSDPAPPVRLLPERPASPSSHGVMASAAPVPEPDFVVERSSGEPLVQRLEETKPMPGVETNDGSWDMGGVMPAAAQVEGIDLHRAAEPAHEPEGDLPNVDLPLIMPEETAQRSRSLPAGETPAPPPSLGPAAPSRQAGVVLADDDGAADTAALSQAKPVVTETMAELYLKQGHQEDALRVYQALLAQRPADLRLRARVQALSPGEKGEGRGVGESVQAFLKRILAAHPRGPRPLPDPAGASSPESTFSLGLPELEPEPDLIAPGAATRPADDSISLDQVFGDEGPRTAPQAPEPPRPPADTGGFSFDQFFGTPAPSAAPPGQGGGGGGGGGGAGGSVAPANPAAKAAPRAPRPAEDEGDLDQFQAWLKGLKS